MMNGHGRPPKKPALWSCLHETGAFMSLRPVYGDYQVLPLFSSPMRCEEWMMRMGLDRLYITPPLWPSILREMLLSALDAGFEQYTLDPPATKAAKIEVAEIDDLLDQVEETL